MPHAPPVRCSRVREPVVCSVAAPTSARLGSQGHLMKMPVCSSGSGCALERGAMLGAAEREGHPRCTCRGGLCFVCGVGWEEMLSGREGRGDGGGETRRATGTACSLSYPGCPGWRRWLRRWLARPHALFRTTLKGSLLLASPVSSGASEQV